MTDRELRSLNRAELLEILINLSEENESLKKRAAQLVDMLNDRKIAISRAGSIAEAALSLNGVFEAAQKASEQYLENIRDMQAQCEALRAEAEAQAKNIVTEARKRADMIIENAKLESSRYFEESAKRLYKPKAENAFHKLSDALPKE